jgi:hypothetical protein
MRRYVRKGEKGIVILAPVVGRKKSAKPVDELAEGEQTRVFGFRAAHVFDRLSRDFRESRVRACRDIKHASLILFGRLKEGGRSPTGVSRPNNAPRRWA